MNNIKIELHADDLGISKQANESIFHAIDEGVVRGVSVIVGNENGETGILEALKRNVRVSLHLNLTDGQAVTKKKLKNYITDSSNNFSKNFLSFFFFKYKKNFANVKEDVEKEIRQQIKEFKRISNLKEIPVDGHNHIHSIPWVSDILINLANEEKINWIRLPYEKFYISSIKNFFCFWFYVNFLKFLILRIFSYSLKKKLIKNDIKFASNFLGILETGHMKFSSIKNGLKKIIRNDLKNEKKYIEILIHPHYGTQTTFDYEKNRQDELILARNQKLKNLIYAYENSNSN